MRCLALQILYHRDIKFTNFMLGLGMAAHAVKLIDFGLSTFLVPGEKLKMKVGSLEFMVKYHTFAKIMSGCLGTGGS